MSSLTKTEKERQKLTQDKCQSMLNEMLRDEDNKYCVDCDAKGPRWASWNLGIYLCIRCAGIHRNLGVHISKVKSVNLDTWTPEQVVSMTLMGNSRGRAVYEANLPDSFRRPQTDVSLENFIRAKYEQKKYIAKEWVAPPLPTKVDWTQEIDDIIKQNKNNKKIVNPAFPKLSVPLRQEKVKQVVEKSQDKVTKEIEVPEEESASSLLFDLSDLNLGSTDTQVTNSQTFNELGTVFEEQKTQKLTKESIMSLYSNQSQPQQQPGVGSQSQGVNMLYGLQFPTNQQQQQPLPPQQQANNFLFNQNTFWK